MYETPRTFNTHNKFVRKSPYSPRETKIDLISGKIKSFELYYISFSYKVTEKVVITAEIFNDSHYSTDYVSHFFSSCSCRASGAKPNRITSDTKLEMVLSAFTFAPAGAVHDLHALHAQTHLRSGRSVARCRRNCCEPFSPLRRQAPFTPCTPGRFYADDETVACLESTFTKRRSEPMHYDARNVASRFLQGLHPRPHLCGRRGIRRSA